MHSPIFFLKDERDRSMQEYTIELRNGSRSTYCIKESLRKNSFVYKNKIWFKKTSIRFELLRWKHVWRIKCFVYVEDLHERGKTYRKDYFQVHKPLWKDRYHCAYCGRILPKNQLAIDHIIPVQKAKTSRFWQGILRLFFKDGVNDHRNLTTACKRCNSRKGAKTSFWVLRGMIGKSFFFWVFLKLMAMVGILSFLLYGIMKL